jgi:hypothetical protein
MVLRYLKVGAVNPDGALGRCARTRRGAKKWRLVPAPFTPPRRAKWAGVHGVQGDSMRALSVIATSPVARDSRGFPEACRGGALPWVGLLTHVNTAPSTCPCNELVATATGRCGM